MNKKSYLLAIDGSRESLLAAEMAWKLAEAHQASVTAQSVVDSQSLWQLIGKDLPGMIGNGPYLAAHEAIHTALQSVSETLIAAYEARAKGHKIQTQSVLDEGNVVHEIAKRAIEHDLVVMGHRQQQAGWQDDDPWVFPRYSLAEHLAYQCPRPLLIVQDDCRLWKTARLVVSADTYDAYNLANFLDFAKAFNLKQEVFCIAPEVSVDKFMSEVRSGLAASENTHVVSQSFEEGDPPWECATDVPASTLLIVATGQSKQGRRTCGGTEPGAFVHTLRLPAVVILPEKKKKVTSISNASQSGSVLKNN